MIDGVYSMYGDFAPIQKITELLNLHKKLYLYADDAHGMGWIGKNGRGYILSQTNLHPKMILATSLNKAFAAGGGAFVIPDKALWEKVKNCGGAFIFSGPHQIPVIGAGIASAKILLSDEIYERQTILAEKIKYCQELLEKNNLPVVSNPLTPIFFIGLGLVRVGYNMARRILNEGCYVNMSVFPAVPETCTGIRFTITIHHTKEDIEKLVKALAYHYPKALVEEGRTVNDVYRAFRRVASFKEVKETIPGKPFIPDFKIQYETSILNVDKKLWNDLFLGKGVFDYEGLKLLENSFKNNIEKENNWNFHYYIIRDSKSSPILATFLTTALTKDDMLAPADASKIIEKERQKSPYYLTSKTLMMGSLLTDGEHLYIDRKNNDWKNALMLFLDEVWKLQDKEQATMINIRDFDKHDTEIYNFLKDQGFIPVTLPDNHIIDNSQCYQTEQYLLLLNSEKRNYIRKKAIKHESEFLCKIIKNPSEEKINQYYQLYLNVAKRSFDLNGFLLPRKLFSELAKSQDWEFIELNLKGNYKSPVGVAINHNSGSLYSFLLTGLDYDYVESHNLYPQVLWQIVKRAGHLEIPKISLGLTASQNKRKFNARTVEKIAFIQLKDSFAITLIDSIQKSGKAA